MKKFLYFATAAPSTGDATDEEVLMLPADNISHFEMDTATRLNIFAKTGNAQEAQGDAVNNIVCGIDITSGKHKEVMEALAGAIASANAINSPFIVIADSEKSKFLTGDITACAAINVVDAS
jgi:hypothetical protein